MKQKLSRVSGLAAICALVVQVLEGCGDDDNAVRTGIDGGPADTGTTPVADSGGDGGGDASVDGGPKDVVIKFKAKVGAETFKCGTTYQNQGTPSGPAEPSDLRLFVQDVKLVRTDGTEVPVTIAPRAPWQTADVALLDFEDGTGKCSNGNPELNDQITGTVPAGTYNGISFTNGVPVAINHADPATAPAPLTAGGMTWGWLLGHIFVKAELASTSTDGGLGLLHLGSTGCTNTLGDGGTSDFTKPPSMTCSKPNRNRVKLTGFDPAVNFVVIDVGTLFAQTDLTATSLCHSGGAACPPLFAAVGVDLEAGAPLSSAAMFKVE